MPRRVGCIRKRSLKSYEIRYTLGVDHLTGKRKTITSTVKGTREEAERELRRLLRAVDTGEHVNPTRITIGQYLDQWSETIRSQVSPKTYDGYLGIVENHLIPTFGHCRLSKLAPVAIQQAYNNWQVSGRKDKKSGGLAPRTRLHIHRVFKLALAHAVRLQLIYHNPADCVKAPRARRTIISFLTLEQSAILLNALRNTRLYWPVLIALTTGMRRGEIAALRWRHVNFERKLIYVLESIEQVRQDIRFKLPKTDRTRAIVLPDYAVEELRLWKAIQARELLSRGVTPTEDIFVCGRYWDGGPIKPGSLTGQFRRMVRTIPNIPVVRLHDLRHSHATQLLAEGIHPKIAQERLGHSSITVTLDLYSHAAPTMQYEAAIKLDLAFKAVLLKQEGSICTGAQTLH